MITDSGKIGKIPTLDTGVIWSISHGDCED